MRIVQVLDYYASGNAVANCAVTYYRYSKRLGLDCAIVARLIDKHDDIISEMSYLDELSDEDIIMYHLCIGTPLNDEICNYKCKKVLVYHNITPPDMLKRYDSNLANACELGLSQLSYMKDYFDICLADSEFNKRDLIEAGYKEENITVIPPFVSRDDFSKTPDPTIVKKMNDGWTNILFVGRVSPHKKYEDAIKIFDYYKKYINAKSRLIFAGGVMEPYYLRLADYVRDLKLNDVIFTKQISFSQLLAYYSTADVFLCMSEHEGYCIPLIEGMAFDIPVIAYDAGAVSGTMGNSGILINDKNPVFVAKIIDKLVKDSDFREGVVEGQRQYLATIDDEHIFNMFSKWIDSLQGNLQKIEAHSVEYPVSIGTNPYDVIVVIKADDWDVAKKNIYYIRKNLNPKRVVVVSSKKIRSKLSQEDNVHFIDEDTLYPGMSFSNIRAIFERKGLNPSLTGWFLQQFLKISYALVCKDEYYLVWDADTIPVRPIDMIDKENGHPLFNMKPEYISPYFSTLHTLLKLKKSDMESFITEHMLFKTDIMKDLISKIEMNSKLNGKAFYEKIIDATDFSMQGTSFSEFETYGTFCDYYYPNVYQKRHLKTFRAGKIFLGADVNDDILEWVSKDVDTISFEYPQTVNEKSRLMAQNRKYREKNTFSDLVSRVYLTDTLSLSSYLPAMKAALEMDYPWKKNPSYLDSDDYADYKEKIKLNHDKIVKFWKPDMQTMILAEKFVEKGWLVYIYDPDSVCRESLKNNPFIGACILQRDLYENIKYLNDEKEIRDIKGIDFILTKDIHEFYKKEDSGTRNVILVQSATCISDFIHSQNMKKIATNIIDIALLNKDSIVRNEQEYIVTYSYNNQYYNDVIKLLKEFFVIHNMNDITQYYNYVEVIHSLLSVLKEKQETIPNEFYNELLEYFKLWII